MNRHMFALFCSVLLLRFGAPVSRAEPIETGPPQDSSAQTHLDIARAAAYRPGQDFTWIHDLICGEPPTVPAAPAAAPTERLDPLRSVGYDEPAQVFDNLYYLPTKTPTVAEGVIVWAITTSEGIILYDAGFDYSVEEIVDNGLRKLGLDPADIRYVIISHGHTDHYGGARHLQDAYGARIILSQTDWNLIAEDRNSEDIKPREDLVATDGMEVTLGDTTVKLYITPGHTRGPISALIPLRDGDRSHLGATWGGMNFNFQYFRDRASTIGAYRDAAMRYRDIVAQVRADVLLGSHFMQDKTPDKINALRFRGPDQAHPFVDPEGPVRHLTVVGECAAARLAVETELE
jgi:metallo-beta-lactamase class B